MLLLVVIVVVGCWLFVVFVVFVVLVVFVVFVVFVFVFVFVVVASNIIVVGLSSCNKHICHTTIERLIRSF